METVDLSGFVRSIARSSRVALIMPSVAATVGVAQESVAPTGQMASGLDDIGEPFRLRMSSVHTDNNHAHQPGEHAFLEAAPSPVECRQSGGRSW